MERNKQKALFRLSEKGFYVCSETIRCSFLHEHEVIECQHDNCRTRHAQRKISPLHLQYFVKIIHDDPLLL